MAKVTHRRREKQLNHTETTEADKHDPERGRDGRETGEEEGGKRKKGPMENSP